MSSRIIEGGINVKRFHVKFYHASICTKKEPRTGKPIDFTPEAEDEVIRKAVSQKLDRSMFNPLIFFEETQIKIRLQLHPYILVTI